MSETDNTNGVNIATGVRVFEDLTEFGASGLECPIFIGDMGGGIGKVKLRVLLDVLRGLIEIGSVGFPTGGAVAAALQPSEEHIDDADIHITVEERAAWNKKDDTTAVDVKVTAVLRTAKEYTDAQIKILSDQVDVKLADTVRELKEHVQIVIGALVDNAPGALDTLTELSKALGDNPNFATDIATQIADRVTTAAMTEALLRYVPKAGDTTIAGIITATDFKLP